MFDAWLAGKISQFGCCKSPQSGVRMRPANQISLAFWIHSSFWSCTVRADRPDRTDSFQAPRWRI